MSTSLINTRLIHVRVRIRYRPLREYTIVSVTKYAYDPTTARQTIVLQCHLAELRGVAVVGSPRCCGMQNLPSSNSKPARLEERETTLRHQWIDGQIDTLLHFENQHPPSPPKHPNQAVHSATRTLGGSSLVRNMATKRPIASIKHTKRHLMAANKPPLKGHQIAPPLRVPVPVLTLTPLLATKRRPPSRVYRRA